jgi:hypothetical protein
MTGEPRPCTVASALEARAALDGRDRWNGALALLDAALEALDEPEPLVITIGVTGHAESQVLALGRRAIALAALTPEGVRAARYVRED